MKNRTALFIAPILATLLFGCAQGTISLEERLHNAYLDSIETKEENLRPLVNLTKDDKNVTMNDKGEVLLFTFFHIIFLFDDS